MTAIYQEAQSLIEGLRQSVADERRAARAEQGIPEPEGGFAMREAAYVEEEVVRRLGTYQRITGAALLLALWSFYVSGQWLLVGEFDSFREWADSVAPYIEEEYLAKFVTVAEEVLTVVHTADMEYQGARLTPERLIEEAGVWRLINMTSTVRREADPLRKQQHITAMLEAPNREEMNDYIQQVQQESVTIRLPYFVLVQADGSRDVLLLGLNDDQFRLFEVLTRQHGQEMLRSDYDRGLEIEALAESLRREGSPNPAR
jgi:hypothetical protein